MHPSCVVFEGQGVSKTIDGTAGIQRGRMQIREDQ